MRSDETLRQMAGVQADDVCKYCEAARQDHRDNGTRRWFVDGKIWRCIGFTPRAESPPRPADPNPTPTLEPCPACGGECFVHADVVVCAALNTAKQLECVYKVRGPDTHNRISRAVREDREWEAMREDRDMFHSALNKINDIRNSIIGFQTVHWSEHVRPLIATLEEVGFIGAAYPDAMNNCNTLLDRARKAETDRDTLRQHLDAVARALHPHWPEGDRRTYVPEQLPNMVNALRERSPLQSPHPSGAGDACSTPAGTGETDDELVSDDEAGEILLRHQSVIYPCEFSRLADYIEQTRRMRAELEHLQSERVGLKRERKEARAERDEARVESAQHKADAERFQAERDDARAALGREIDAEADRLHARVTNQRRELRRLNRKHTSRLEYLALRLGARDDESIEGAAHRVIYERNQLRDDRERIAELEREAVAKEAREWTAHMNPKIAAVEGKGAVDKLFERNQAKPSPLTMPRATMNPYGLTNSPAAVDTLSKRLDAVETTVTRTHAAVRMYLAALSNWALARDALRVLKVKE